MKIESKTLLPGSGNQDLAAKMWQPGFGSQDLESYDVIARIWKARIWKAGMWKPGSESQDVEASSDLNRVQKRRYLQKTPGCGSQDVES